MSSDDRSCAASDACRPAGGARCVGLADRDIGADAGGVPDRGEPVSDSHLDPDADLTGEEGKLLDRRIGSRVDGDETPDIMDCVGLTVTLTRPGASWGTTGPLALNALPRLSGLFEKKLIPFGSSDSRRACTVAMSSKLHISSAAHSNLELTPPPPSGKLLYVVHLTLSPNLSSSSSSMAWP